MDTENEFQNNQTGSKKDSKLFWMIAIMVGAWFIGMGILGAGWLISRELASKNTLQIPNQKAPENNNQINIAIPEGVHTVGNNDAKVIVIEFADYQCPYCGQWQEEILPELKREYIDTGKIKFIYWDFAFLGDESVRAAEAAQCAADQGKFWEYHDALFSAQRGENEGTFSNAKLKSIATGLKLDTKNFNSCFDARTHQKLVEDRTNQAADAGVNSTPTVSINGYKLEGVMPWEKYKQVIEAELGK